MYFLKDYKGPCYDAGSKARIDCEDIMKAFKCEPIDFYLGGRKIYYMSIFKRILECKKLNSGDTLIIQYPYYFKYWDNFFSILQKLRKRNIKVVAIIHDVLSLRPSDKKISIKEEMEIFNNFDAIISHNEEMSKFLRDNGVKSKIVDLEIFDYLINKPEAYEVKDFKNIHIAGNLSSNKSKYIYDEEFKDIKSKIYLYGPNFEVENIDLTNSNIQYKGCFKPEDLGKEIKEGFGLVWDGTSVNTCDGAIGEYLKYNNPHKTSMYLSIGMPIIVWEKAAISKFIKKYNLGISIKSLKDIDSILNKMTITEYLEIKKNCEEMGKKIRNGYFLQTALKNVIDGENI